MPHDNVIRLLPLSIAGKLYIDDVLGMLNLELGER